MMVNYIVHEFIVYAYTVHVYMYVCQCTFMDIVHEFFFNFAYHLKVPIINMILAIMVSNKVMSHFVCVFMTNVRIYVIAIISH